MSKGLEALEEIKKYSKVVADSEDFKIIENELKRVETLEKARDMWKRIADNLREKLDKQDKILKIIKEKVDDISWLKCCDTSESYNNSVSNKKHLTQEQFELLKEVLL